MARSQNILKELDESINYGGTQIPFKILLSRRKTISIMVYTDQSVKVRAPHRTSIRYIKKSVEKRAQWIKTKQDLFSNYIPPIKTKRRFESGEVYTYLGNKYELKINRDLINKVELDGNFLNVSVTNINKDKIKKLINNWFKESAKNTFLERMEICKILATKIEIKYNDTPKLRKMRSMWGSCSRAGKITLSTELIKAPIECIDYVILHELCHIREFNHSRSFYDLMEKVMPDWKHRKDKLKQIREFYYE